MKKKISVVNVINDSSQEEIEAASTLGIRHEEPNTVIADSLDCTETCDDGSYGSESECYSATVSSTITQRQLVLRYWCSSRIYHQEAPPTHIVRQLLRPVAISGTTVRLEAYFCNSAAP